MNILQKIFTDHYEEIKYTLHPRKTEIENIDKMINCGDSSFGGAMYGCPHCGKLKFIPFRCHWKEPSEFYGGMSFREMEGKCLENGAENLVVTPQDAEADEIISAELENYVAGNQTMDEAIANMDKNLKAKIGKAEIVK